MTNRVIAFISILASALFAAVAPGWAAPVAPPPDRQTYARPVPPNRGAAALSETLRKLGTRASLIMVTAHPDDEDGGMLAYESRHAGADVSLLTLNRGEGGQNLMSSANWDELGLLRTEELLAADRYYGVHQYWTRVADFGFSKTLEESLDNWEYNRVLYDVVRVIRMTRPLVVTSVFTGSVADGHGQHQVAGMMAQEAYKAAGDPKMFPDQIRAGLLPWSPLKVYARVPFARVSAKGIYDYATGRWAPARFRNYVANTWIEGVPSTTLKVPEGQYDPAVGLTCFQLGREGLNEQKSQIGGVAVPPPAAVETPYHLYASRVASGSQDGGFFSGIDVSLEGIADDAPAADRKQWTPRLHDLQTIVAQARAGYVPGHPERIAPLLARGLDLTNHLLQAVASSSLPAASRYNMTHELLVKQRQFNRALREALGLNLLAVVASPHGNHPGFWNPASTFQVATAGQNFDVDVHVANQGAEPVVISRVELQPAGDSSASAWKITGPASSGVKLSAGEARTDSFSVTVPAHAALTRPYFTRRSIEQPYYDISDPADLSLSTMPYPLAATVTATYNGVPIRLRRVVQTIHDVTGPGPTLQPLLVGPAISIWLDSSAGIVPIGDGARRLEVTLRSNVEGAAKGTVRLELPPGWTSAPASADWATTQDGDVRDLSFEIHPRDVQAKPYSIRAIASYDGQSFTDGYQLVGYTGLRPYPFYRPAVDHVTGVDVDVPKRLRVGYIMGPGDDVPRSLEEMNVHVSLLSPQDVALGDLSKYDAIVIGIRAYAVRPDLTEFRNRLLQYVHDGGVLLVQYQRSVLDSSDTPYPVFLGNDPEKVVVEKDPVTILRPKDPLFTWPNQITPADFSGWIEERGHGFMGHWSSEYIPLTEVHDPDQAPQKGGLIYARYGRGIYIYAAYAFYRELQQGVPGAFRIFANLISAGKNPGFATPASR